MFKLIPIVIMFCSIFLLTFCKNEDPTNEKVYTFLEVCYEDFYLNRDVKVTKELHQFEEHLINEGHLADTSGASYKSLLNELSKNNYFKPPLNFDEFNNTVLYQVPDDLLGCAESIFGIDSTLVKNTPYFKAQKRIREELKTEKEISINQLFKYNSDYLSNETITSPFVKQSILQLLYRWYFKSKYDREASNTNEHVNQSDSTQVEPK